MRANGAGCRSPTSPSKHGQLEDYGRPDVFIPMFQQGWAGIDGLQTMAKVTARTAYRVRDGERESVRHDSGVQAFSTLQGHEVEGFVMPSIEALSLSRSLGAGIDTQMLMSFWLLIRETLRCSSN